MSAAVTLEDLVRSYALRAVKADKEGKKDEAIYYYKKAIEGLSQLITLYPDSPFRQAYEQMINEYKARMDALQRLVPANDDSEQGANVEDFIVKEKPKITFNDIVGLEDAKEALREAIVYPSKRPDLFPLGWPRGILLYGPPGNGKTMLAAAVANEIDSVFMQVDAASIMSKWLGEAEKNVAKVFKLARETSKKENKPVIIFIDEIDALLGTFSTENGGEVRVRNQFLKEMDGLQDKSENFRVYVIGATNKPWRLDEPFLRRFQKRIYIPLPDERMRVTLLKAYTQKIPLDQSVDLVELAKRLDGYSASDIKDVVQAAYMRVIKEMFRNSSDKPRNLTMEDFLEVLKTRKPSSSPELIKAYQAWSEKYGAL